MRRLRIRAADTELRIPGMRILGCGGCGYGTAVTTAEDTEAAMAPDADAAWIGAGNV